MSLAIYVSPPASPLSDYYEDQPVVATDALGMIVDERVGHARKAKRQQDVKIIRKKREPRKYVSKHFTPTRSSTRRLTERNKVEAENTPNADNKDDDIETKAALIDNVDQSPPGGSSVTEAPVQLDTKEALSPVDNQELPLPPGTSEALQPRIYYGLNVDALSSDSELSDVPSDIGPDPFRLSPPNDDLLAFQVRKKPRRPTKSPYFPSSKHKHRQHFLTTLPFPSLSRSTFGLMQERLAHDPFRLLIATIFLNKTPGERAMPIFFELMKQYPTPLALSQARVEDITEIIRTLGFQNQRARKCVAMAKAWVDAPPEKGKRYRKLNYPCKGDGRNVKEDEIIDESDERVAWEISHLPGLGPYSHDSWRMFCRDQLRGVAEDWLGTGAKVDFEPEWRRVLPLDKELRAWMTWMWLKEGWTWNKETGERTEADSELLTLARDGGVVQEVKENDHLIVKGLKQETVFDKAAVETPAGEYIPE